MTFAQFGIDATFVDSDDPENFRPAIRPNTKAVYAETIGNPQLNVADLAAVAEIAHAPAFRWSSTTRWPRRICAGRSSTARTSSSTR